MKKLNLYLKNQIKGESIMKNLLISAVIFITFIFFVGCAASSKTVEIFKPQELYRSPALDFTKVSTCGIMPINSLGSEYPEITGILGQGLFKDLKALQKAWEVISDEDLLRKINDAGMGRGYQNYIADFNTFATVGGATPLFTAETQNFFEGLKDKYNIEALLFVSYKYSEQKILSSSTSIILQALEERTERRIEVYSALYDISSKRVWWVSRQGLKCDVKIPLNELVSHVSQSIGQNFGKGILRQL